MFNIFQNEEKMNLEVYLLFVKYILFEILKINAKWNEKY